MKWVRRVGLVAVLFGGLAFTLIPCACVTPVGIVDDVLHQENRRALEAQQAYFAQHGRYAQTVAELGYELDGAVDVQSESASNASIAFRSTYLLMPEATCRLDVRPDTASLDRKRKKWGRTALFRTALFKPFPLALR